MDYHAQAGYLVAYQAQSNELRAVHSLANEAPHIFEDRFDSPQNGRNSGYGYQSSSVSLMQQRPLRQVSSALPDGSHASPPSPKRARIDGQRQNPTPSRLSSTGAHQSGLALPSIPLSQPHQGSHSSQYGYNDQATQQHPPAQYQSRPVQPDQYTQQYRPAQPRTQSFQYGQNTQEQSQGSSGAQVQERLQDKIPAQLEQQIRPLAQHDGAADEQNATIPSGQRPAATAVDRQEGQTPSTRPFKSQQGAKVGNALRLACQACQRRKMRCSRNFPCSECQLSGDECVPSTRKRKLHQDLNPAGQTPNGNENSQDATNTNNNDPPVRKLQSELNPNRKYLINLPPVIGSYCHWSNMRLKYDPIPSDVDDVRDKLFVLEKPVLLNSQQYSDYWPHVTNIYGRSTAPSFEPNGTQIEVWECRNQRRQSRHRRLQPTQGHGKRERKKKNDLLESDEPCKMRFRIVAYIKHADTDEDHRGGLSNCRCVPEWLHLEQTKSSAVHNHSLLALDKFKRSDAMLHFARHKVEEGPYMYAAVKKWIKSKYGDVSKQAEYVGDHDVANAARVWRIQNRDVELLESVEEPSPEEVEQKKYLDLLGTTTANGLRRVLAEICTQIPAAVKIALPCLEAAQEKQSQGDDSRMDGDRGIQEGDNIQIPEPGMPTRVKTGSKHRQWLFDSTKTGHAQAGATAGPDAIVTTAVHQTPPAVAAVTSIEQQTTQIRQWTPRQQSYAQPAPSQQPRHPAANVQPQTQQDQLSHSQSSPSGTLTGSPMVDGPQRAYTAPYGSNSVDFGGLQHQTSAPQASEVPPTSLGASAGTPRTGERPTWAKPATFSSNGAEKAKAKTKEKESEEEKVARQLEAELRGSMHP